MSYSIYLDFAAATPMSESVLMAMKPYFSEKFYNPSAIYLSAKSVRSDINIARTKVAKILGTRPAEIIFTAGGTEANNMAIKGIADTFPGSHLVSTGLEHDSVRFPMDNLKTHGWGYTEINPKPDGIVDVDSIIDSITDKTVLVSVMYANNEIGTLQPIRELSIAINIIKSNRIKKGNKLPLYLHTDACQAANYLDLNVSQLGVDMMTLNGGKIYGPKQSGVLYVSKKVKIEPLIRGGGQEFNKRSGTENIPSIIGFAKALEDAQQKKSSESKRLKILQIKFIKLLSERIPAVTINGSLKRRLPNNVHITLPGIDNERIIMALDEKGILVAAGSACSASSQESSHVLKSIGLSSRDAQSSIRFTLGRQTKYSDIEKTVSILAKLVAR